MYLSIMPPFNYLMLWFLHVYTSDFVDRRESFMRELRATGDAETPPPSYSASSNIVAQDDLNVDVAHSVVASSSSQVAKMQASNHKCFPPSAFIVLGVLSVFICPSRLQPSQS